MFDGILKHRSGRVIALARAVLAALFLFAIWIDPTQPAQAASTTYAALGLYLVASIALAAFTWSNWWADAKLAAPVHVIDIAVFSVLVFATEGYTSPFFVFFVFLVLSAAIRWGWRETAITATAVTLIFLAVGLAGRAPDAEFDLQRFIIRTGNLIILSAILIWFGVNHGFTGMLFPRSHLLDEPEPGDQPIEKAAEGAMKLTGARKALLLWRAAASHDAIAVRSNGSKVTTRAVPRSLLGHAPRSAFLFDVDRGRALMRSPHRRMVSTDPARLLPVELARDAGVTAGLGFPLQTDAGSGLLLLGDIDSCCTDHIEFGNYLSDILAAQIQRHALLTAVGQSAAARSRLSLARDLHDSIVQFLAGATFRIEAIKRAIHAGDKPEGELDELKQLLLVEQQELRSSIGALRKERISLPDLAADLKNLCVRLTQQWGIRIMFAAEVPELVASMRLHLDLHQLIREAVANAVRHAGAKTVRVQLSAEEAQLRLDISNDGKGIEALKEGSPWSLRERVDEANGTLMLATRDTGTDVTITLPLTGDLFT